MESLKTDVPNIRFSSPIWIKYHFFMGNKSSDDLKSLKYCYFVPGETYMIFSWFDESTKPNQTIDGLGAEVTGCYEPLNVKKDSDLVLQVEYILEEIKNDKSNSRHNGSPELGY